jgi:hypothetical protein
MRHPLSGMTYYNTARRNGALSEQSAAFIMEM